ncbi:MAG: RHS repeat-associated core domain-containing protein, partial [Candidatus Aminicenantes bacterium]|nr:RHS repeat-associated core domain-containing protein [Candidatus Aminicenantes bacterium]
NSYAYGAWGEVRAQSVTVPNIYGYTGREFAEEGLYYYRARYLDPRLGRFVAEDPMRFNGGMNFYVYVGNHPSEFSDPYGLQGCGIVEREGPNIRIGEPFTRTRWFGYWRALLACSVWKAAIISTGAFELPGKYPELCEFTIVYYEYWRYDSSTDLFFECEDACGEVEYSIFLDNEPAGKPWDVLKRTWEETAYVLDYVPFWKGKGKERFFRKF